MGMRKTLSLLALVGAIGCGAAPQASTIAPLARADFGAADRDRDDALTPEEFLQATEPYAAEFDLDRDGRLDREELARGLFRAFDENGTGRIDEAELARGAMRWWPEDVEVRFDAWNTHPDRGLDVDELRAAVERLGLHRRFDQDRDGAVSHADLADVLFRSWDLDESDSIDPLEWRWD